MLSNLFTFVKTKGSSPLPAHGSGGARSTIKLKAPQKNRAKPEKQKSKKEGGLGEEIFALLRLRIECFRFSLKKRNIRQYGGQAPQKNFLFLLKEKIAREKIKKCRENFSVLVCRSGAEASGNAPHSCSGFSLKKVRISFRIRTGPFAKLDVKVFDDFWMNYMTVEMARSAKLRKPPYTNLKEYLKYRNIKNV